jgi:ribose transport system substrate-binding protein
VTHSDNTSRSAWRGRRMIAAAAAALALATSLAACSSSGSGGTSTPPVSNPPASNGGGGTSAATTDAGLAVAQAMVAKFSKQPTSIPIKTPIGKPIPKGKLIEFVSCGTPNCAEEGAIIKEATDLLGWTLKVINTDGTPQTQQNAFNQVVRDKAFAVLYSAVSRSTFASAIPQLEANHTFVAGCCITDPVGNGIDYAVDTPDQTGDVGNLLAAWTIADSKGTAQSVYVNLPAFPILSTAEENYKKYTSTNCSKCSVDVLDIPVTALGKDVPTRIVSYLRAHSDVKYVDIATDALTIGLPAAIKAAGLSDIKIIGQGADTTNLQYIHAGQENASVAFPYYEILWGMVDAAARKAAGVPVLPSIAPTLWLLTKDNAPNATKIFPTVDNYASEYKTLWGIS